MELTALQPRVNATNLPLDRLAGNSKLSESQKVSEAGKQFEAVLLRQILGEAMKPNSKSSLGKSSAQAGIYQDMVVNQMADNITHAGGVGLAKSLNHELNRQLATKTKSTEPTTHD